MARLDRLPASSKEVAQVASVIGREFDRNLLAEVVALSGSALDDALRKLLAAQLVVMGGMSHQTLLFRHALIQDTAYQSLLSRKRRQYHQAIADTIVKSHPDIVATQPELVARHYTDARRADLALPYWKKAGERALERSANYEAVDHFSNVLAIVEGLPERARSGPPNGGRAAASCRGYEGCGPRGGRNRTLPHGRRAGSGHGPRLKFRARSAGLR
jgi:predicted ATPase